MAIILIGDEFRQWLIKNIKQFKNYYSRFNRMKKNTWRNEICNTLVNF